MDHIRVKRGISLEVWEARPYTPWTPEDVTPVLEAYEGLTRAQVRFMRSLAVQKPGLIIHRHAVPGAPHVWPEIRPEGLVRTGPPTMHWHGAGEPPELPPGYSVLPRGSEAWREHCRRVNDNDLEEDDEHEDNHELHRHENLAKYCFPSSAWEVKPWPHDHTDSYYEDPAHLERHLARWHQEPVETRADGKHVHYRKVKSKESLARRLDVHPMAAPLFADAELVYFGIEGCLKADSILSAILREGRRESVFSVPSVSLWDAPEFDGFIRYLRGKRVVVVPDADWFTKRQVLLHARLAQRYLKNRGIESLIAAPPLASEHKGVDDYLGDLENGGTLDELEVLDRTPSEELPAIIEYRRPQVRADALRNMVRMIHDLAFFADEEGHVQVTHRTMSRILGVSRGAVQDNLKKMEDFAWIEVEQHLKGSKAWERVAGVWKTRKGYATADGRFFRGPEEWALKTRIRVHERLRSTDLEPCPLRDLIVSRT